MIRTPSGMRAVCWLMAAAAAFGSVTRGEQRNAGGDASPAPVHADRGRLDANGNWVETEAQKDLRMAWWREARFGMFIHWGLYSVTAGQWKGKRQTNKYGEWIMIHFHIPVKEYETIAGRFNPIKFDADAWVRAARDAGMKYIVITAKHHDGFAMFESKVSRFNIVDATPFKRDPMKELAAACRKYGIKLCFYYSQSQDWHEPDGLSNYWDFPDGIVDKSPKSSRDWVRRDFPNYMERKALPQVRELLGNYGPLGLIWYDTPRTITEDQARQFIRIVRETQPACLVNSRIFRGDKMGDYGSTGDNSIPGSRRVGDWEMPGTMNDTWGYRSDDHNWKSSKALIRNLVDIVSKGGNYLLNVGPTGEGEFTPETSAILRDFGTWMKIHGESIYGTQASPFGKLPWGRCTVKGAKVYLHVFDWPTGPLVLKGMEDRVLASHLLTAGGKVPLKTDQTGGSLRIALPEEAPDESVSVIVLEIEGKTGVFKAGAPGENGSVRLEASGAVIKGNTAGMKLVPLASASGQELLKSSRSGDFESLTRYRVSSDDPRGGAAAATMVLNALSGREACKPDGVLTPATEQVVTAKQVGDRGFTLRELAAVIHTVSLMGTQPKHASDLKYEHGYQELLKDLDMVTKDPRCLMLMNFSRASIEGSGTGHVVFGAVGAFSPKSEMVLILPAERKENAFWIRAPDLYTAMNTLDEISGRHMGWIVTSKPYPFLKEDISKFAMRDFGDQKPTALQTPEGQALLDEKTAADYLPLKNAWVPQIKSHCAACTAVIILNALQPGGNYNQYNLFQKPAEKILTQDVVFRQGFTLEQMAAFIPARSGLKAEFFHAGTGKGRHDHAAFIEALKKNRRSADDFMMVNMKGHFSPVGDYNEARDRLLVLEVASSRPSYWISSRGMFDSMNTVDNISKKNRGWIVVHR